jgi:hypothetical protein
MNSALQSDDRARQKNPNIHIHPFRAIVDLIGKPHPLAQTSKFFADKEVLSKAILEDPRDGSREELKWTACSWPLATRPTRSCSMTN